MATAETDSITNPTQANTLWGQIDQEMMAQGAPWVPLFNPKLIDFVAKRIGNYQFSRRVLHVRRPALGEVAESDTSTVADPSVAEVAKNARGAESPWRSSLRQLWRNRPAMVGLLVFLLVVVVCLMAPIYAHDIAHTNPFASNIQGTFRLNGRTVHVLQQNTQGFGIGVTPIGPTWNFSHYFLGADDQGRDVFARLLYGGRNDLLIGTSSALICCFAAAVLGVTAGYFGGPIDWVLSRIFDIIWAFPIYLLAISLSVVLLTSGLQVGPFHIGAGSLMLPVDHRLGLRALRGPSASRHRHLAARA